MTHWKLYGMADRMRSAPQVSRAFAGAAALAVLLITATSGAAALSKHQTTRASLASSTLNYTRVGSDYTGFGPVRQGNGDVALVNSLIFSNLVKVAPNEKTIVPDLATSWTISPNARVFTFKLRHGVTWSDGSPFTSADVVFTINEACQFGPSPYIGYTPILWWDAVGCTSIQGTQKTLSSVQALGSYEVKVTIAKPDAQWVRGLTDAVYSIVPQHILQGATAKTISTLKFTMSDPVGTGPYVLTKQVFGQYDIFTANPHYFMGEPKIQRIIEHQNLSDATEVAECESGELQLCLDMGATDYAGLSQHHNLVAAYVPTTEMEELEFRTQNPQVSNYLVRQAIIYAVDWPAVFKAVTGGHGTLLHTVLGFDQNAPGLNPYSYNPTKAKQLLQEAHFNFSQSLQFPYSPTADPTWSTMVPAIASYLEAVGINVVQDPESETAWAAQIDGPTPNFAITVNSGGAYGLGPYETAPLVTPCDDPPVLPGFKSCHMASLYAQYQSTNNPAKAKAIAAQIGQIWNTQVPVWQMWQIDNVDAWSPKLGGSFHIFANDRDSFFNIWNWTLSS